MKRIIIFLILASVVWNCKQKAESPKAQQPTQETNLKHKLPKTLKEITRFADISVTDSTDIGPIIGFKMMDSTGVNETTMEQAMAHYKKAKKTTTAKTLPIFEIKNTDDCVLIVSGKGYVSNIWGKLLIDRSTLEIKKVEFDHKAESEGYGDGITLSSFENQFVGTKINWQDNTFGLKQGENVLEEGATLIDGISGATMTGQAVLKMVNEGLQEYRGYLDIPE